MSCADKLVITAVAASVQEPKIRPIKGLLQMLRKSVFLLVVFLRTFGVSPFGIMDAMRSVFLKKRAQSRRDRPSSCQGAFAL